MFPSAKFSSLFHLFALFYPVGTVDGSELHLLSVAKFLREAGVPAVPPVPGRWWTLSVFNAQWRPCFFLKILLKAFLLRLPEDSLSSPPSSSTGLLLGEGWTPTPRQLLDKLDEAEDEKTREPSTESGVTQRERVDMEEAMTVAGLPLSSPRLELFSRAPPVTLEA